MSCFLLHYFYRSFIYPLQMQNKANLMPLFASSLAFAFCFGNGYLQGRWLGYFSPVYPDSWLREPRFIFGLFLFFAGFGINIHSDHILRNLRKPGEKGYKIPHGGFFEYVSAANYFGEILEWTGWAIACWSFPSACFAFFTFANIGPRGMSHHQWYKTKCEDYPPNRKAVIPFIW